MSVRFKVAIVGRSKCRWAQTAVDDYTQRIRRLGGVDEMVAKAQRFGGNVEAVRAAEGERLIGLLASRDRLVALDERGEDLSTSAFTQLVDTGRQAGTLVFAIGGAYGLSPEVRKRAWRVVRLSSLVLNHDLARVVLYEQLYRALTQIEGIPYHH